MPIVTLRDLYFAELQDLFDAEQQILQELPAMASAATSAALREAYEEHLAQTQVHVERLELLLRKLDVSPSGHRCDAIRGLIAEARRRVAEGERGDVLDAALIGAAQRIEHYEIAAYGCARTYARTLGDDEAVRLLQQTLDEEGAADARLTRIAERGVNEAAAENAHIDTDRQRARLRFVPAAQLRDFKYRDYRVRNVDEDLGHLDGVIIESRSGHPVYFVVDSGGWFVGQRYLVPVDALRPDDESQTLRTDLTREAVHSYPPFDPDTFAGAADHRTTAAWKPGEYQPPTWLMTGVWMTEASGFASVPPRAQSDFGPGASYPENELMMARGEPEARGDAAERAVPDSGDVQPRDTEDPKSVEPRIERYRER